MKLEVIILAAGQGTRMKSSLPKVLHLLAGRPLLEHVIATALSLQPSRVHVVIGHGSEQVQEQLADFPVNWVVQHEQLGTGHGVLQAVPAISPDSTVLVLYGDVPLVGIDTLATLVAGAATGPALLTACVSDPAGYGRILRDSTGALVGVVEHKDATEAELLDAVRLAARATATDPDDASYWNTHAAALCRVGEFAESIQKLDRSTRLGGGSVCDDLIRAIAEHGRDGFYGGAIATTIAA